MDNIRRYYDIYKENYKNDHRIANIKENFLELINLKKERPIILYGAGVVTLYALLELLTAFGIKPDAIIDSDNNKWGRKISNIEVSSLHEVHAKYGTDATVIITVRGNKNDMLQINKNLKDLGFYHIIQCSQWLSYREVLGLKDYNLMSDENDQYIADSLDDILSLYNLLEDNRSRDVLEDIVRARLMPFDYEYKYYETSYFPEEIFSNSAYNYVVDCGAYRGDTLEEFLKKDHCVNNLMKYHAFEMDSINVTMLKKSIDRYSEAIKSKINIYPFAVSDTEGEITAYSDGSTGSHISINGNEIIKSVTLDEVLGDLPVSLIKMDIEGAEQSALRGAKQIIQKNRPVLVISLYHRNRDLWEIPKFIHNSVESYVGLLRHEGLFDYIYFAIPKELYLKSS